MKKIGLSAVEAEELRKKYPEFVYKGYTYETKARDLHISFDFAVPARRGGGGEIKFRPRVVIKNMPYGLLSRAKQPWFDNLVFHLGLAEMPSYWKATASPKIIIEAGSLNKAQINWWHYVFTRGMGQYFYENKIDFRPKNFLAIESSGKGREDLLTSEVNKSGVNEPGRILVPIGGGKDAVVTYELLKKAHAQIRPFVLNPKREQEAILKVMGERNPIIVERTIDPELLELNRKGYLNGHTPFSAYLAFLTTLCAALFDYKYIALSNERSSNEGNVDYLGSTINHQYSKSFDFEKKFRAYSKKYLAENVDYFSFLRPLYELQIAKLFSQYPKYFGAFLSCNEAHKTASGSKKPTGTWCGKCSKCLFVFASLYPFGEEKQLISIFGSNLFRDQSLIPLMEELVGDRRFKPFECVGTIKESLAAFYLCLRKTHPPFPALLKHFRQHIAKKHPDLHESERKIMSSWNTQHTIPLNLEKRLRSVLH